MKLNKVIVVGLDGLEPGIVEPLMAAGELPNLARLRERGGYGRVATTSPAQTPVAWSTFATGVNPGGHGIFDFLRRDPRTYLPDLALNRYEQKNAFTPPKAVNLRRGVPLWDLLSAAGVNSEVIRCPCTYPPDPVKGRLRSGMGVPDVRGGLGTGTYYTTQAGIHAGEGEQIVQVTPSADGSIATALVGPRNPKDRTDLRLDLQIRQDTDGGRVFLKCAGATPGELEVRLGVWSGWLRVKFKLGMLRAIKGIVRFRLMRLGSEFALYASPINFDPETPLFPISSPEDYAWELGLDSGPYYTTGMVEDHAGLSNGRIDEAAFLDQCDAVWDERESMMVRALERGRDGFYYCLFDTPDRVQHMFWRFREPDHPANLGKAPPKEYVGEIERHYRRADRALGAALRYADDKTLTIALSDHGFGSFRRCVDINAWLYEQGLLALEPGVKPGHEAGDLLLKVDWSKTKAYALGLGGIYLNLQGREGKGIVAEADAEALKQQIARNLKGLADPESGAEGIREVKAREELYSGPYVGESPDLLVHFNRGYRVSWGTSMGGVGSSIFTDNTNAWGGDHIVDPSQVPGVLFMDRSFRPEGARLLDLAPTILAALGVPAGPAMEGSSLLT